MENKVLSFIVIHKIKKMKTKIINSKDVRVIRFVPLPRGKVVIRKSEPEIQDSEPEISSEPTIDDILDVMVIEQFENANVQTQDEPINEILTNEIINENVPNEEMSAMPDHTQAVSEEPSANIGIPTELTSSEDPIETSVEHTTTEEPTRSESTTELTVEPEVSTEMQTNSESELPEQLDTSDPKQDSSTEIMHPEEVTVDKAPVIVSTPIVTPHANLLSKMPNLFNRKPRVAPAISVEKPVVNEVAVDLSLERKIADDLTKLIKNDWRYTSWGYLPDTIIKGMIATNNQFKYDIVKDANDFKNGYIKIISHRGEVDTNNLAIK